MPDCDPEPGVELTGVPVVPPPIAVGTDPTEEPWLFDAVPAPLVVVVFELQAVGVTGAVVVPWDAVVVLCGEVVLLWQSCGAEPASVEGPAA